jgi:hypothetical protein
LPATAGRLVQLVPPARVDLADEVLARIGRRRIATLHLAPVRVTIVELAFRVKRFHLGEVRLRGSDGATVEVVAYIDTARRDRLVYQLRRGGQLAGESKTAAELGRRLGLGTHWVCPRRSWPSGRAATGSRSSASKREPTLSPWTGSSCRPTPSTPLSTTSSTSSIGSTMPALVAGPAARTAESEGHVRTMARECAGIPDASWLCLQRQKASMTARLKPRSA